MNTEGSNKTCRIEFAGLPGAGKTTLCAALAEELRTKRTILTHEEAVSKCLRNRAKGGHPGRLVKMLPRSFWMPLVGIDNTRVEFQDFICDHSGLMHLLFEILDTQAIKSEWRNCIIYVFFRLAVDHELLLRSLPGGCLVLQEEGFVQGVLSLLGYVPFPPRLPPNAIDRYISNCPLPDFVLWVDTPPSVCLERLFSRPELPLILQDGGEDYMLSRLTYLHTCIEQIMERLEERGVNVWRADGIEEKKDSAREIAQNWVASRLNRVLQ
jgi:hypothetical protein